MKKNLSRREFIKSTAIGTAGVAITGMGLDFGINSAIAEQKTPQTSPSPTNIYKVIANELNPQDYDFTSNSVKDFSKTKLFEPWKFGSLTIKNRLIKSAAGSAFIPTVKKQEIIEQYARWAKNDAGFIWIEDFVNTLPDYPSLHKQYTRDDNYLKEIVDAIHKEGCYCGYQLYLMNTRFSGFDPSTAPQYESAHAEHMTLEELKLLQHNFIDAAKYLHSQGCDAIEINAAGNNIGQAFLSRNRNYRTDEYGTQTFENRVRFLTEIIQGIKKECGKDFPVQILINGIEENDKDLGNSALFTTVEENKVIAQMLEAAGADSLHVRLGPFGMHVAQFASDLYFTGYGINGTTGFGTQFDFSRHFQGKLISKHSGIGAMLNISKEIKSAVKIPVGAVTCMDPARAPDFFVKAINEGMADFLLMTRTMIAEPEYILKLKEGRLDEIRPCTRCLHCHFHYDENGNFYESCRVNATHLRAYQEGFLEGYDLTPTKTPKNIMVIGAGPAGMEASAVAAKRGHHVTLYEKNGYLGGLLPFANAIKGPHENLENLQKYLSKQLELSGVNIITGKSVDAELIKQEEPDVIILACGGKREKLDFMSTPGTKIVSIDDIMSAEIGENITIVGSNAQAVDITMYLQAQGKHITIITPDDSKALGKGQSSWVKTFTNPMIYARGTRVWPHAKLISVGDGEITFSCETGVDMTIACDTIIEAMDMLPNTSLTDSIEGISVFAVGDCAKPDNIAEAIATGNIAGRKV